MNKKKIVIASILKPLLDSRHYERFALSLAKTNKYEVNIIANGEKKPDSGNIRFFSNGDTGRHFIHRLKLQWKTCFRIIKTRPDLLIVCTIELLPYAFVYSIFNRCKLVYDIQENYALNFKTLKEYTWYHRGILAPLVRMVEGFSNRFVHHYFLAERCYSEQLHYLNSKFTVLENKTVLDSPYKRAVSVNLEKPNFLFSGTISSYSGIYLIFDLISYLNSLKKDFEFTIIGQVIDPQILADLLKIKSSNIHIKAQPSPVPHDEILKEIRKADLGVIAYQSQSVNARKVPTKLYEYVAHDLPYLVESNSYWNKVGTQLGGAIPIDFNDFPASITTPFSRSFTYSYEEKKRQKALWVTEEMKFIRSINTLLI